jgi:diguanylate cyclase (GGDEF)-like protein
LWIGTYSGDLNRYDPHSDRFFHYTTRNGMAGNNILSILEGDNGRIWCATRAGINIVNPKTGEIRLLDERDGLFGVFFNFGNLKDEDGSLYFGGSHGVTKIDSAKTYTNPHPPEVHITSVNVFEEPLENSSLVFDDQQLSFKYSENFLSFEFIALDFEAPRHNQYAYKMEGFDREWVQAGSRAYASYTNLPPGTYRFRVKASNNDRLWNEEGASLSIHVIAPWYRKWWAFLLYGIGIVGILSVTWRLRSAQLLRRQNAELEYTNRLLERANTDLERLSVHDSLTDVFNRRYFEHSFYEEWQRARRARYPLALLMIDIDHFKQFNDAYGHVAGDRALELIAQAMRQAVPRNTDFVARYGGEEFAAVLFQTDLRGSEKVAKNIKDAIAILAIPVSQPNESSKEYKKVSVSIGIHAEIPDGSTEPEDFIHAADRGLYRAKSEGRNTIRPSSDTPSDPIS